VLGEVLTATVTPFEADGAVDYDRYRELCRFLVDNVVPVTLGNVVGGALMVGAIYWFVYLRGREALTAGRG